MIKFRVVGKPEPKGSKSAFPIRRKDGGIGVATKEANPNAKGWMDLVGAEAQRHVPEGGLIDGPVRLTLLFTLLRPKSISEKKRPFPTVKPDIDKIERAVMDGLAGKIYTDDSRVVQKVSGKQYGDTPGVEITVEEMQGMGGWSRYEKI